MRFGQLIISVVVSVIFLSLSPGRMLGQGVIPSLNGHVFVPSESVDDPFVETNLLNQLGIGVATNPEYPLFVFQGDTVYAPRGSQLYAVVRFDYQQKIKDWLGVRWAFNTIGRLGTNAVSILSAGVTASTQMSFDWKLALLRQKSTLLTLDIGFRNQSTTFIDITGFVGDIIDGEPAQLVKTVPTVVGVTGLNVAHAFSPAVGLKAVGTAVIGSDSQTRETGTKVDFELGGAISVSGREALGIPVSALLAASYLSSSFDNRVSGQSTHSFELKVVYSVPGDFSIGPTVSLLSAPTGPNDRLSYLSFTLSSRYYF